MSASKRDQDLQKRIQQLEAQRNSARIPLLFSNEGGRDWSTIVTPVFDDYGLDPYVMRCVQFAWLIELG